MNVHNILRLKLFNIFAVSQAVVAGNTMYISGQIALDATGQIVTGGVEKEAEQVSIVLIIHGKGGSEHVSDFSFAVTLVILTVTGHSRLFLL